MKSHPIKINYTRIVFFLLSIACMAVIFVFSSENSDDSSSRSGSFTQVVIDLFVSDYNSLSAARQAEIWSLTQHIIRKAAHFTIYMSLGFCTSCAIGKRRLFGKGTALSLLICFLYACSDELHQYFVPGRSCQFSDVLLDTSGALTGILISMAAFSVIGFIIKKLRKNQAVK